MDAAADDHALRPLTAGTADHNQHDQEDGSCAAGELSLNHHRSISLVIARYRLAHIPSRQRSENSLVDVLRKKVHASICEDKVSASGGVIAGKATIL